MKKTLMVGLTLGAMVAVGCNRNQERTESALQDRGGTIAPQTGTGGAGNLGRTGQNTVSDTPTGAEGGTGQPGSVGAGPGTGAGTGTGAATPITPGTTPEDATVPSGTGTPIGGPGAGADGGTVTE